MDLATSPATFFQHCSKFLNSIFLPRDCYKLEHLECLRSEDTPRRLIITHTIESYWIPSQKMTKWKLQIVKIPQNLKLFNFETGISRETPFEVAW